VADVRGSHKYLGPLRAVFTLCDLKGGVKMIKRLKQKLFSDYRRSFLMEKEDVGQGSYVSG